MVPDRLGIQIAQIGRQVEMHDRQPSSVSAQDPGLDEGPGSLIELMAVPSFVTSA
jgi:hypothetical protein